MFSSKSVIKGMRNKEAKSFLSEDGIIFSDGKDSSARKQTGEELSHAHTDSVAYTSFLGTVFHQEESGSKETEDFQDFDTESLENVEREAAKDFSEGSLAERDEENTEQKQSGFSLGAMPGDGKGPGLGTVGYSNGLVQQSIERAEKLLEISRREAEKVKEEARLQGYEEGLRQGREDGRQEIREELQREWQKELDQFYKDCAVALGTIEELKQKRLSRYLDELKDVAIAVAEKVIHVSLRSSGEVIRKMILQEAEKLKKTAWLKIYIDKAEYEMLLETDSAVASELSGVSRNIRFVISEKSELGKLIMETPDEIVDLSIGTQMESLRTKLGQLPARKDE